MSIIMQGARLELLEDHLTKSLALLKPIIEENQKRKLQEGHEHYEATVEAQIRREFEQQQKDELPQAAKNQIIEDLKDEMRPRVIDALVAVLRDQLEAELRPKIEAELRVEVYAKLEQERTAAPNDPDATSLSQLIEAAGAQSEEEPRAKVAAPNGPNQQTSTTQAITNDVLSLLEEELGKARARNQFPATDDLPDYEYYERVETLHPPPSSPPVDPSLVYSSDTDKENIIESIESPDPPFHRRAPAPPSGNTTADDDDEHWELESAASAESHEWASQYRPLPPRAADEELLGSCKENAINLDSDDDDDDDDYEELSRAAAGRKRGRSGEEEEMAGGRWKRQRMGGQDWAPWGEGERKWEEGFKAEETLMGWGSPLWVGSEE